MKSERDTEDIVWERIKPRGGAYDVYKQGCIDRNSRLYDALAKAGGKPAKCALDDFSQDRKGSGKPEFIVTFNEHPNTILVYECKKSVKDHSSKKFDHPKDYAVDGVLYYAKFLKKYYNVIAIAVSGTEPDKLRVSTFDWRKNAETYLPLKNINELCEPLKYLEILEGKSVEKKVSLEEIRELALEMHNNLRVLKITERNKPVFIAGILIALKDENFSKSYATQDSFSNLLELLKNAISRQLTNSDVPKEKINDIQVHFQKIGTSPELSNIRLENYNSLRWYIEQLDTKIKPMMDHSANVFDALGIFYHEFVRYSGGDGSGLGIVLTPQHLAEFMVELAEIDKKCTVIDICCGSGAFLVTAMSRMINGNGIDEETKANPSETERIKREGIYGIELDDDIYTLAIANMIVMGDGKSNIMFKNCFDPEVKTKLKNKNINRGLINPPYAQTDHCELDFVERMLDILNKDGIGVAVVPMSCAIGTKFKNVRARLFQKHRLEAVFSMPDDIFYSNGANTNVCVMKWRAHCPHDPKKDTFFGYYKDDGFVKAKKLGRIDKLGKWKETKAEWLRLATDRVVKPGLTAKHPVTHEDEWLCEAYMETDYSKLQQSDFETAIRQYLAYSIKSETHATCEPGEPDD